MNARRLFPPCLGLLLSVNSGVATVRYVDVNSTTPSAPYISWGTAATAIQSAVDVSVAGDEVVVSNGVYATGGATTSDSVSNRVEVNKAIMVRSVNGPQFTTIRGLQIGFATNAAGGVRCVYLTNNATLSGFTLVFGSAPLGGGVLCEDGSSVVTNCIFTRNAGGQSGGGIYNGTIYNSSFIANVVTNGGAAAYNSALINCTVTSNSAVFFGGGAAYCTLLSCIVRGNTSQGNGGGVDECQATNCLLIANSAATSGGGAYGGRLYNCTVVGNSAGVSGGGGYGFDSFHIHDTCNLYNSIIYSNMVAMAEDECWCTQYDCCTPTNSGPSFGRIAGPPLFVDQAAGNFRLQSASPCIDAGDNSFIGAANDLDGNPRILGESVDSGAYEFQPADLNGPPALTARLSGNTLNLAWPLWASNYALVEASSVSSPAVTWTNTPGTVVVSNAQNNVTVPKNATIKLYMLQKP